ncbi:MAG: pre-peptidase C-terminal domain-containing protein, partial [Magnetococcales bacterium]|nr:pre-peptidase C-terminal domain-containing protein [Magnetococcales bacterium]
QTDVGGSAVFTLDASGHLQLDPSQFNSLAVDESVTLNFSYNVNDGTQDIPNTVAITIEGSNDLPKISSIEISDANEDVGPLSINLLAGVVDDDLSDVHSVKDFVQTDVDGGAAFSVDEAGNLHLDPSQFSGLAVGESVELNFSYKVFDGSASVDNIVAITIEGRYDQATISSIEIQDAHEDADPLVVDLFETLTGGDDSTGYEIKSLEQTDIDGSAEFSFDPEGTLRLDPAQFGSLGAEDSVTLNFAYVIFDGSNDISNTAAITIAGRNDKPEVVNQLIDQTVTVGDEVNLEILEDTFFDIDNGDQFTLNASMTMDGVEWPVWLTYTASTGTLTGTPGVDDVGVYKITFTATDVGLLSASESFNLIVEEDLNDAPVLVADILPELPATPVTFGAVGVDVAGYGSYSFYGNVSTAGIFQEYGNSDGGNDLGSGSFHLALTPDGHVELSDPDAVENIFGKGVVSSEGDTLAVSIANSLGEAGMLFAIQESELMSVDNVVGLYHIASTEPDPYDPWTGLATLELFGDNDQNNVGEGTVYFDSGGSFDLNYTVSDSGHLTIIDGSTEIFHGMVSEDGDIFSMVSTESDWKELGIGIRVGDDLTQADFSGSYSGVELWSDQYGGMAHIESDGVGMVRSYEVGGWDSEIWYDSYVVGANGTLTVTSVDGETVESMDGFLTADGSFAVLVDNSGGEGGLIVLTRDSAHSAIKADIDDTSNVGMKVEEWMGRSADLSDAEGDLLGMALTGVDESNGDWFFSLGDGGNWQSLSSVSESSALLLNGNDWVRFVPHDENAQTAGTFTYQAWDKSDENQAGTIVDVTVNGGTTAYSADTGTAVIKVNEVASARMVYDISGSGGGVVIDGFVGDWADEALVVTDPLTDNQGVYSGLDITGLHMAQDETSVFLRIDRASTNLPGAEMSNYWVYFRPIEEGGQSYSANVFHGSDGSISAQLYNATANPSDHHTWELIAVPLVNANTDSIELNLPAQYFAEGSFALGFYTHHSAGNDWPSNGDSEDINPVLSFNSFQGSDGTWNSYDSQGGHYWNDGAGEGGIIRADGSSYSYSADGSWEGYWVEDDGHGNIRRSDGTSEWSDENGNHGSTDINGVSVDYYTSGDVFTRYPDGSSEWINELNGTHGTDDGVGLRMFYNDSTGFWQREEYDSSGIVQTDSNGYVYKHYSDGSGEWSDANGNHGTYDGQGNSVYYGASSGEVGYYFSDGSSNWSNDLGSYGWKLADGSGWDKHISEDGSIYHIHEYDGSGNGSYTYYYGAGTFYGDGTPTGYVSYYRADGSGGWTDAEGNSGTYDGNGTTTTTYIYDGRTTTTYPDGSQEWSDDLGNSGTYDGNGQYENTFADGTSNVEYNDGAGNVTTTWNDGRVYNSYAGGASSWSDPNTNSSGSYDPATGISINTYEGLTTTSYQDGSSEWFDDQGNSGWNSGTGDTTRQNADGSSYIHNADGSGSSTNVDGFTSTWDVDGNLSLSGADNSIQLEGGVAYGYRFKTVDFNFSDSDGDDLQFVKITDLPAAGSLRLENSEVSHFQDISATDIDDGKLVYYPGYSASDDPNDYIFKFTVSDGADFTASEYAIDISIPPSLGDISTGSFSISDQVGVDDNLDVFGFTVSELGFFELNVTGDPDGELELALYGSSGLIDYSANAGTNEAIEYMFDPGTYFAEVTGWNQNTNYTLDISPPSIIGDVNSGQITVSDHVGVNNDVVDRFGFTVSESGVYELDITAANDADLSLSLYDDNGVSSVKSMSPPGGGAALHYTLEPGTYYAEVYGWWSDSAGYTLEISPPQDLGDLAAGAVSVSGQVGTLDNYDWYEFTVSEEVRNVELSSTGNPSGNLSINLYDDSSNYMDSINDGWSLHYSILSPGTYNIEVYGWSEDNDYTLDISLPPDFGDVSSGAITISDHVSMWDNVDWYAFTVSEESNVELKFTDGSVYNSSLSMSLYNDNYYKIDDTVDTLDIRLHPGNYYVEVDGGWWGDDTDYTLDISTPKYIGDVSSGFLAAYDQVGASDNYDWFEFSVSESGNVELEVKGSDDANLYVSLHDEYFNTVVEYHIEGSNIAFDTVLDPGTYYAQVIGYSADTDYVLTVSPPPVLGDISTDGEVTVLDRVGISDYTDLYEFSVSTESYVNLQLTGDYSGELDLVLFDSYNNRYASSRNSGSNESIDHILLPGTYYAQVEGWHSDTDYALKISPPQQLGDVSSGPVMLTDYLGGGDSEYDIYEFTVGEQSNIQFLLNTDTPYYMSDLHLQLLDGYYNPIMEGKDSFNYTLDPGSYFIQVENWAGDADYTLELAPPTVLGDISSGAIEVTDQIEWSGLDYWYEFSVSEFGNVELLLAGENTNDLNLTLLDAYSNTIIESYNYDPDKYIEYELNPGTYYAKVSQGGDGAEYSLRVSPPSTVEDVSQGSISYSDRIGQSDTEDRFEFVVSESGHIQLQITGEQSYTPIYLELQDVSGNFITYTSTQFADNTINQHFEPGTYYAQVNSWDKDLDYNLDIAQMSFSAGDIYSQAPYLGQTADGVLTAYDQVGISDSWDRFEFYVSDSGQFQVSVTGDQGGDFYFNLLDIDGSLVRKINNYDQLDTSDYKLSPGTYLAEVMGWNEDENYTLNIASPPSLGDVTAGSITMDGQVGMSDVVDWYSFTVSESGFVQLYLSVDNYEAVSLTLLNSGGSHLSGSEIGNPYVDYLFSPGTYYALVSHDGQDTDYTIGISQPSSLGDVSLGAVTISEQVSSHDKSDWHMFSVSQSGSVTLDVNGSQAEGWSLNLLDANGVQLDSSANLGTNISIERYLEPGNYYAEIVGNHLVTNYTLEISPPQEVVDISQGGITYSGLVGISDNIDSYEFIVSEQGNIELQLAGNASGELDLRLFDSSSLELTRSWSSGSNDAIDLVLDPGTYYAQVEGWSDDTNYTLEIAPLPDLGDISSGAVTVSDQVGMSDYMDLYEFSVSERGTVELSLAGDDAGELNLRLLDSSSSEFARSWSPGSNEAIDFILDPGTYYAQVDGAGLDTDYTLTVSPPPLMGDISTGAVTVSGLVGDSDNTDIYEFSVTERTLVELQTTNNDGSWLDLHLIHSDGWEVAHSGSSDYNNTLEHMLDPGTYFAQIGGWSVDTEYTLEISPPPAVGDISNGAVTVSDQVGYSDIIDQYEFFVSEEGYVELQLTGNYSGALDLRLFDGYGAEVGSSVTDGSDESINYSLAPGTYYAQVEGWSENTDYTLEIAPPPVLGDVSSGAVTVSDQIGFSDKYDRYEFFVSEEGYVELQLTGNYSGALDLRLFDGYGTEIGSSVTDGSDESVNYSLAPGTYYAQVEGWSDNTVYTLELAPPTDVGDISTVGVVNIFDQVGMSDNYDWYEFSLSESGNVELQLSGNNYVNLTLQLLSESGSIISSSNNAGFDPTIDYMLSSGTYYAQVEGWSENTDYNLEIAKPPAMGDVTSGAVIINDQLSQTDNSDMFEFSVSERSNVQLQLKDNSPYDVGLRLLHADGWTISESSGHGSDGENIDYTLEPGTYYAQIEGWVSENTHYSLEIAPPTYLGDITASGAVVSDQVGNNDYEDWYEFSVAELGNVSLELSADAQDVELGLSLHNEEGTNLLSSWTIGSEEAFEHILQPGNYLAEVHGYGESTQYTLQVSPPSLVGDDTSPLFIGDVTAASIITVSDMVGETDNVDRYEFAVTNWDNIELNLSAANPSAFVELALYGPNGEHLADTSGSGLSSNAMIDQLLAPGNYHADVVGMSQDTDYTLDVVATNTVESHLGSDGDDILIGSDSADMLDGGAGNDSISAGAGDDIMIFDESDDLLFDGGTGHDTLLLETTGEDEVLVLSQHQRIDNIEVIDMVDGADDNVLVLGMDDLLDVTDDDNILTVEGDMNDDVVFLTNQGGAISKSDNVVNGYENYVVGDTAQGNLLVDEDINVTII